MSARHHWISFGLVLRESVDIDELAREVSSALGAALKPSEETDDYCGELLGLPLWLTITQPEMGGPPEEFVLLGERERGAQPGETWVDIGPYVAELLRERTGRAWEP
jgi:hypothetical protein